MEISELNACMEAGAKIESLWAVTVLNVFADCDTLYVDYIARDGEPYIAEIADGQVQDIGDSYIL